MAFSTGIYLTVSRRKLFKQSLIPTDHLQTNPVEEEPDLKTHLTKTQLAIFLADGHTELSDKLPSIRFAMNSIVLLTTGFTPDFLTFGREMATPNDVQRVPLSIVPCMSNRLPHTSLRFQKDLSGFTDNV